MSGSEDIEGVARLILVLGDQLSHGLSSLRQGDARRDVVLMAEVASEATYVPHHKKKIAFVLSAMRHFASELREAGWTVDYIRLDDPANTQTISGETARAAARHGCSTVLAAEPGEWRLREEFSKLGEACGLDVEMLEDDRFICSHDAFSKWSSGRKQLRLEYFYREMRRSTGLLMDGDQPEGERWNFDQQNRKPPAKGLQPLPPIGFEPDEVTREVLKLVEDRFCNHFGDLEPFWFAVTRVDAEAALDHFIRHALLSFGDYQDAMIRDQPFMFHAVISLYLNAGLLMPLDVCSRVEAAYRAGAVPLNAAEGFIRQVIGWREFIRGVYWLKMPEYVDGNFLGADRPLPSFYWSGKTEMACLADCIGQTRREAYAHHIQRLMVTGNFAMLAGIRPAEVHEWYLAVYADAYEWVEAPNTLGMSQFADGGLVASKPYAAGGNYINRMSNYCAQCRYDVRKKTGPDACPFNYLYWDFIDRNRGKLQGNPRLAQIYRTLERMSDERRQEIRADSQQFLRGLGGSAQD